MSTTTVGEEHPCRFPTEDAGLEPLSIRASEIVDIDVIIRREREGTRGRGSFHPGKKDTAEGRGHEEEALEHMLRAVASASDAPSAVRAGKVNLAWVRSAVRRATKAEKGRLSILPAIIPRAVNAEVYSFLEEHSIREEFERFVSLALDCFKRPTSLSACVQGDPEEPKQEWVVLRLEAGGPYEAVRKQQERFRDRVFQEFPRGKRNLMHLSLIFAQG